MTWTLKLRDGVTFSDGTPLNADAVVWSINRYNELGGLYSKVYSHMVQSTTATGPSTVQFEMKMPWRDFPAILSFGHGMIVAPSSQNGTKFTPIGAGPFTLVNLRPQQGVSLKSRADYWGGKPYLNELNFVSISGDKPKIDALKSGGVDMIYLRSSDAINEIYGSFPGYIKTANMGVVEYINNRPGHPGSSRLVRKAMAYAIDPDVINQRGYKGQNVATTDMFGDWSKWHGETSGIDPDPAKARELLTQAKEQGFDGRVSYVAVNTPTRVDVALAVQAQLNAVGFDTTIEYVSSMTDMVNRVMVDHDYDMAQGAFDISDVAPEIRLFSSFHSARDNPTGLKDANLDQLIDSVFTATESKKKAATIDDIQEYVNANQPFLTMSAGQSYVVWSNNVFGVKPSIDQIMLFDKAFIKE